MRSVLYLPIVVVVHVSTSPEQVSMCVSCARIKYAVMVDMPIHGDFRMSFVQPICVVFTAFSIVSNVVVCVDVCVKPKMSHNFAILVDFFPTAGIELAFKTSFSCFAFSL